VRVEKKKENEVGTTVNWKMGNKPIFLSTGKRTFLLCYCVCCRAGPLSLLEGLFSFSPFSPTFSEFYFLD